MYIAVIGNERRIARARVVVNLTHARDRLGDDDAARHARVAQPRALAQVHVAQGLARRALLGLLCVVVQMALAQAAPDGLALVAVDDALMDVTTVIRAEEHLTNTVRQILILEALGYDVPKYAHLSLVLGEDRSKLSLVNGAG